MFERFTDGARRVITAAQDEARRLRSESVGPEHLLLGLLADRVNLGVRALEALGADLDSLRERIEKSAAPGRGPGPSHLPFTPSAKAALEQSLREALDLGRHHIGPEHLLLGILHDQEGMAGQALAGLGVSLERARGQVATITEARPVSPGSFRLGGAGLSGRLDEVLGRLDGIAGQMDRFAERLDDFADRLAAIERTVGGADHPSPDGEDDPHQ